MKPQQLTILMLSIWSITSVAGYTNRTNPGESTKLSRTKRVAIFDGQGVSKIVVGVAHPVKQRDKEQSFWWFYVLQGIYTPTTIPIYYWSFWNTSTFVSTAREWRKDIQTTLTDDARTWVYDVIEATMELLDGTDNGPNCLLRAICEVSQLPFEENHVFSELLNAVLVPKLDNVGQKYLDARDAGRAGADCTRSYMNCSKKLWSWLTHVTKTTI